MTSKLTREQRINEVKELIANAEEWAGFYEHPIHDKPQREMFEGMAKVMSEHLAALAAMDNEPVAWTDEEELRDVNVAGIGYLFGIDREANKFADPRRQIMLYRHAQPGPVVPDDTKLRELFDSWFASDCSFDLSPEASEADNIAWRESYWYVWKRCRAAMLQAGNSPVIPDGYRLQPISEYEAMCATVNSDEWPQRWIPVSERMPEDRTQVILWDAEIGEVTSGHYSHKTHTFYHCGDAIQNEITHWMPLPAAPQEVKP